MIVLQEVGQSTRSHQDLHHFTMFLLLVLAVTVSPSLGVDLEKLFRDKISDARCFSQCQQAQTAEDQDQCFVICKTLEDHLQEDLCSLTAVCTGGCKVACDAALRRTLPREEPQSQFQAVSLQQCELTWDLENNSQEVVFMVAGRDQGGMWNLMKNHITSQHTVLTARQAAKFVELQLFAISAGQVAAVSLDISNNHCHHTVPVSRQWREDQDTLSEEQTIQNNTSIIATTVLSVLAVFAFMISVSLVIVRWRNSRLAPGEDHCNDIPELPYSVPGRALQTSRDNSSVASDQPSSDYEVVQINFGRERNSS